MNEADVGGGVDRDGAAADAQDRAGDTGHRILTITNQRGLHARAAAKFVRVAGAYEAVVRVRRNGMDVCGESIMGLMMLAASEGTEIEVLASGIDAEEALLALEELVSRKFDEE